MPGQTTNCSYLTCRQPSNNNMFCSGINAATAALIQDTFLGMMEDVVLTVSSAENTPPPTNVQPG